MTSLKDVPNGELRPEKSELQLADMRIRDLETELEQARQEIARLRRELESLLPSSRRTDETSPPG